MTTLNRDFIISKLKANRFTYDLKTRPLIVAIRETDKNLNKVPDTTDNICDTIILMDETNFIVLSGRTIAHKKYWIKGGSGCNKIASSYVTKAWRKGLHRNQYRALVQNVSFYLWRSTENTTYGDADDVAYNQIVGDNFHALAPWSAGCVTVQGYPELPQKYPGGIRGDWKTADNYLYNTKKAFTFFDACILEHKDVEQDYSIALRLGSTGQDVIRLQTLLGTEKKDADFGPMTFEALRKWQSKNGFFPDGIAWPEVLTKLGFGNTELTYGTSTFNQAIDVFLNTIKKI